MVTLFIPRKTASNYSRFKAIHCGFDAQTGALLRQLSPPQNSIFDHLSPDGRLAVSRLPTQPGDGIWVQSLVWRTSDGEVLHLLDGLGRFAPDNQSIVTFPWRYIGCCNQTQTGTTYRFYDLESGELTSSFDHSERITSFDWSGDSQRLVTVRRSPVKWWFMIGREPPSRSSSRALQRLH